MDEQTAKAYSEDVVIVRVGTNYPPSAMSQIVASLRSRGVAAVVIACEDVAVVRGTLPEATPTPIDPTEITHPDDVEVLRREVRAWRKWFKVSRRGKDGGHDWQHAVRERVNASAATDAAGALG